MFRQTNIKYSKSVSDFAQELPNLKYKEIVNNLRSIASKSDSQFETNSGRTLPPNSLHPQIYEKKKNKEVKNELFLKKLTKIVKSKSTLNIKDRAKKATKTNPMSSGEPPVLILCVDDDDDYVDDLDVVVERDEFDTIDNFLCPSPVNLDPYSFAECSVPKGVLVQRGFSLRKKLRKSVQLEVNDDTASVRDDLKNLCAESRKKSSRHNSIVPQVIILVLQIMYLNFHLFFK